MTEIQSPILAAYLYLQFDRVNMYRLRQLSTSST